MSGPELTVSPSPSATGQFAFGDEFDVLYTRAREGNLLHLRLERPIWVR
jgi:hypothetical protein